ncbi:MAG: hypothetical protein GXP54_07140 [Deltaproteobacteria bacterium]|nr:hypothetical protein [Deltaproteobacteria bacterium]
MDGFTIRETAKALGCCPATVLRRERKALFQLREGFTKCGYGRDL